MKLKKILKNKKLPEWVWIEIKMSRDEIKNVNVEVNMKKTIIIKQKLKNE